MKVLFLKGDYREKIWGGDKLKNIFKLDVSDGKVGEYWGISGMAGESSVITNGEFKDQTLREIYENHKDLFGNPKEEEFPLLVKLIDAGDDLSIQVHPDDEMAARVHGAKGKTECWYILNEDPASIIYGLNVDSKEEAIKLIDERKWDALLKEVPTKLGDFFFVRSGTVHAIKKGSLILEIQQASDITYRLYDYDRKDDDGNLRDLHLEESKEAIKIIENEDKIINEEKDGYDLRILTANEYFEVREMTIKSSAKLERSKPYLLEFVVVGQGELLVDGKTYPVKRGDFFIITNEAKSYEFKGQMTVVESNSVE